MTTALPSVYQIKVTLEWSDPPIWRQLLVPSTVTLPQFHAILQAAMGWTNRHLHQFIARAIRFGTPDPEFDTDVVEEHAVPLDILLREKGDALVYEYDFGDGWRHRVELEQVLPPDPALAHPKCIAGERACPPEDVGGVPGYEMFLDAIRDPANSEHDQYLGWVGGHFDPEAFDVAEASRRLSQSRVRTGCTETDHPTPMQANSSGNPLIRMDSVLQTNGATSQPVDT